MRSDWSGGDLLEPSPANICTKNQKQTKRPPPLKKKQISDMQTSTLSRNKYTKSWGKASGGLPAFQSRYTDTWFQQYGHTDIVGQGHFIKHLIRNERCYWSRGVGCICFLPRHMKKWSVLKFACQKKKKKSSSFNQYIVCQKIYKP